MWRYQGLLSEKPCCRKNKETKGNKAVMEEVWNETIWIDMCDQECSHFPSDISFMQPEKPSFVFSLVIRVGFFLTQNLKLYSPYRGLWGGPSRSNLCLRSKLVSGQQGFDRFVWLRGPCSVHVGDTVRGEGQWVLWNPRWKGSFTKMTWRISLG